MCASGDFRPTAPLENLRRRAELLSQLRSFFQHRQFLEVETPLLSADTVIDRHLDPLPVTLVQRPSNPPQGPTLWLQTSPEFAMKRLLASGATAIYQVTHAFRGAERGQLHNPEFTMAEWYRVGDTMRDGMQLLADLIEQLLGYGRPEVVTYQQAFLKHANVDPHQAPLERLIGAADKLDILIPESIDHDDRDEWLNLLMAERVQPHLGLDRPTILCEYPESQAAMANVRPGPPPVAERFELFVRGIELANGYHELLDADELEHRNQRVNGQRRESGKYELPEQSRLLRAMQHGLPQCSGTALGFDRLVMLALGATSLDEVIAFPIDRA